MFRRISFLPDKCLIILAGTFLFSAGEIYPSPADSTVYHQLRDRLIVTLSTDNPAVRTADALAAEGFYTEALEILSTADITAPAKVSADTADIPVRKWQRRLSTGIDYFRLQDVVDTMDMNEEENREYNRLTETPLSLWSRFRCTGIKSSSFIKRLSPEIYLSNYRSAASLPLQADIGRSGTAEFLLKAGKWFRPDASSDTIEPFSPQKSDMLGGSVTITPGKDGRGFGSTTRSFSLPVGVDLERYRTDRIGYESYIRYMATPSLQIRYGNGNRSSLRISSDIRYDDYLTDTGSYLDAVQLFSSVENTLRGGNGTHRSKGMWYCDYYTNRNTPSLVNRIRLSHYTAFRLSPTLSLTFDTWFIYENEENTGDSAGVLSGTQNSVKPSLRIALGDNVSLEPLLQWEYRRATTDSGQFVWRGFSAWEPMLRFQYARGAGDVTVLGSYRWEDSDPVYEEYHYYDNHNIRIISEGSITFRKVLTLAAQTEYHFCLYTHENRMTENITAAGTISYSW